MHTAIAKVLPRAQITPPFHFLEVLKTKRLEEPALAMLPFTISWPQKCSHPALSRLPVAVACVSNQKVLGSILGHCKSQIYGR